MSYACGFGVRPHRVADRVTLWAPSTIGQRLASIDLCDIRVDERMETTVVVVDHAVAAQARYVAAVFAVASEELAAARRRAAEAERAKRVSFREMLGVGQRSALQRVARWYTYSPWPVFYAGIAIAILGVAFIACVAIDAALVLFSTVFGF